MPNSSDRVLKFVATGNDFLFLDARNARQHLSRANRPSLVRRLCDRHWGLGADGMVFVEDSSKDPTEDRSAKSGFRWDFYNCDGSKAEMCGNASRCMGRWFDVALGVQEASFQTHVGVVSTAVVSGENGGEIDREIAARFQAPDLQVKPFEFTRRGRALKAWTINTGVPHVVLQVRDVKDIQRRRLADASVAAEILTLRHHPQFGRAGSNVTFLEVRGPENFATATFERGVEDFTLSCGTGVLAAAAVGLQLHSSPLAGAKSRAQKARNQSAALETPGGQLRVQFDDDGKGVMLQGSADFLFDVSLTQALALKGKQR